MVNSIPWCNESTINGTNRPSPADARAEECASDGRTACACADSGLGRATPPRRAASPGLRTLGSPASHSGSGSGPGSLPGAIGKRRHHASEDTSDVSSTHSSIMDYSGEYCLLLPLPNALLYATRILITSKSDCLIYLYC